MKSILNSKNITTVFAFLLVVLFLSSCNRGGYGCPYELEAASNLLNMIGK